MLALESGNNLREALERLGNAAVRGDQLGDVDRVALDRSALVDGPGGIGGDLTFQATQPGRQGVGELDLLGSQASRCGDVDQVCEHHGRGYTEAAPLPLRKETGGSTRGRWRSHQDGGLCPDVDVGSEDQELALHEHCVLGRQQAPDPSHPRGRWWQGWSWWGLW